MDGRRKLLGTFSAAWSAKDVDALMDLMAQDCEFRSSVGPEPGGVFLGREEVRRGFGLYLAPAGASAEVEVEVEVVMAPDLISEHFGVTRWTATSHHPDGTTTVVRACDVFEFEGALIRSKDTYRKMFGALPSGPDHVEL